MNLKSFLIATAVLAAALMCVLGQPLLALGCLFLFGASLLKPLPGGQLADATLIVPILTGKVMAAFRQKVPELGYFSTDFGKTNGQFVEPVRWKQEVISQLASVPTAVDYTPGDDITSNAQSAKDLVTDLKVKIDRAKIVKIKLPANDAATLLAQPAFMASLSEAGKTLGRAVIADAAASITPANFSHELVLPAAEADIDSLKASRIQLNVQAAGDERYVIGNSSWVGSLGDDTRISLNTGHNQRITDDPYARYQNIEGFREVREFVAMPTTSHLAGFAFEKRAIHIAFRRLLDSVDLAEALGIPVPILRKTEIDPETGLAFVSLLYIEPKTLDLYAAFIVAYGIRAGRAMSGAEDPSAEAVNSTMDRCGVRIVEQANA